MTTFNGITPSTSTQLNYTYRVNQYAYGNGYKAIGPDGANATLINSQQIQWNNLTQTQWLSLKSWFDSNKPWTTWNGDGTVLPSNLTFRITADGYQAVAIAPNVYQVQLSIEQVF